MTFPKAGSPTASSKPGLLLASESPRRRALLAQVGIVPDAVLAAEIDETPKKAELARALAARLAAAKAESVSASARRGDMLVLAADTVVAAGRRILPKAKTADEVCRCLAFLSGRRHQVITAVAVLPPGGKVRLRIVATRVAFRRLTPEEITAYAASHEGEGKAGGYAIQGRAGAFVVWLNGSYSGVVGLPLSETVQLLRGLGYPC
jgi:septum formation protein